MQLLKVWSAILVAMRICAAVSIPAPDPNQPKVDKLILPFTLTEVEGTLWDCIKCNVRCSAVVALCGAVCIVPEPEVPLLCVVRI